VPHPSNTPLLVVLCGGGGGGVKAADA
jgi:hypothetical protein